MSGKSGADYPFDSLDEVPHDRIEQLILNQLISVELSSLKLRRIETIPFAVVASAGVHVSEGRSGRTRSPIANCRRLS